MCLILTWQSWWKNCFIVDFQRNAMFVWDSLEKMIIVHTSRALVEHGCVTPVGFQ